MAVDKDVANVLQMLEKLGMRDLAEMTVEQARATSLTPPPAEPTAVADVVDRTITGSETDVPLRIYTPQGTGPFGALVYFHGGGWVIGSLDSHDETCRKLCAGAGVAVISVDYRLAPETRFPGPLHDCFDATVWVHDHAAELNVDASRIAVGGDSAGGNLAAACALLARDRNGPALAFQLLIYPVTDASFATPSYHDNAEGYLLSRNAMMWFWDHYVPQASDRSNAYAAPLAAEDLTGLPPALVQTAEYDPLRDEGEAYATALQQAGCSVAQTRYAGLIHGYFGMQEAVAAARPAMAEATAALRQAIG